MAPRDSVYDVSAGAERRRRAAYRGQMRAADANWTQDPALKARLYRQAAAEYRAGGRPAEAAESENRARAAAGGAKGRIGGKAGGGGGGG